MKKSRLICNAQSITILDKTPQKTWENISQTARSLSNLPLTLAMVRRTIVRNP
jgi:hypothetical protein